MIRVSLSFEVDERLSDTEYILDGQKYDIRDTVRDFKVYYTEFDERVCHICIVYHGQKFDIIDDEAPMVPQHPRCRCYYSYSQSDDGMPRVEAHELPEKMLKGIFGVTRAKKIKEQGLLFEDIYKGNRMLLLNELKKAGLL